MNNITVVHSVYYTSVEIYEYTNPKFKNIKFKGLNSLGDLLANMNACISDNRPNVRSGYLFIVGEMKRW